ncbi:MAG TPA: hypothetical protein VH186_06845 [Chloroflexia bacterium]|nr:hypothetical protein [Chloroflexia bacterium]
MLKTFTSCKGGYKGTVLAGQGGQPHLAGMVNRLIPRLTSSFPRRHRRGSREK